MNLRRFSVTGRRRASPGVQVSSRALRKDGSNPAPALATAGDIWVRNAARINIVCPVVRPRTLRIRYTGPITPVDTGKRDAVLFTWLSVLPSIVPECGAAASVAKAIAALAILLAITLRYVLGHGPRRLILGERLRTLLLLHGRRRRRFGRRCWRRRETRWCGRRCWNWVGMLDTSSRWHLIA